MKAFCIERLLHNNPFFIAEEGNVFENVLVEDDCFILGDIRMSRPCFFNHFKADDPEVKMTYSDFEYILCNYEFTMALFLPQDISDGEQLLIIKDWDDKRIYISCNKNGDVIRASFNHSIWRQYGSYEEALEGIRKHEWN